jgi:hypothetical protein
MFDFESGHPVYVNSVQVAKTHLSFATAFFPISESNKDTKGPENHCLG